MTTVVVLSESEFSQTPDTENNSPSQVCHNFVAFLHALFSCIGTTSHNVTSRAVKSRTLPPSVVAQKKSTRDYGSKQTTCQGPMLVEEFMSLGTDLAALQAYPG
eukprot:6479849-Amphidinium_carterae.1